MKQIEAMVSSLSMGKVRGAPTLNHNEEKIDSTLFASQPTTEALTKIVRLEIRGARAGFLQKSTQPPSPHQFNIRQCCDLRLTSVKKV